MVNYNSGIYYNKQHYQPQNTLVQSVAYSYDIYENQVIVGFIKTVINELGSIRSYIVSKAEQYSIPEEKDGYVKSSYYIFTKNTKVIEEYLRRIDNLIVDFQNILSLYQSIFLVKELHVIDPPKYTNIFRSIMPYRIIFNKIIEWFNCGDYDLTKSNLLLSFISISKIYEYFCLLKINNSLVNNMGFVKTNGYKNKYQDAYKYLNTTYNNVFEFENDNTQITVYFQPVIYGKRTERYGIELFRNTNISIRNIEKFNKVYTPDYLLKINNGESTCYYIMDAKHSQPQYIKREKLAELTFKYIFSISPLSEKDRISGLCILCGKTENNRNENLHDIAHTMGKIITPRADLLCLTGKNVDDSSGLIELLKNYISD